MPSVDTYFLYREGIYLSNKSLRIALEDNATRIEPVMVYIIEPLKAGRKSNKKDYINSMDWVLANYKIVREAGYDIKLLYPDNKGVHSIG